MKIILIIHIAFAFLLYLCTAITYTIHIRGAKKEFHADFSGGFFGVLLGIAGSIPLYLIPVINILLYVCIMKDAKAKIYKEILNRTLNLD